MDKQKIKKMFIIMLVLWCITTVVLVLPFTVSYIEAKDNNGTLSVLKFTEQFQQNITKPFDNISKAFSQDYISTFGDIILDYTAALVVLSIIVAFKAKGKGNYYGIEHGSSDWSENGEQYNVLNYKKGIILAEKNYLPVDNRGNTNVLVVGRFWFSENLLHMLFQTHVSYWVHMFLQTLKVNCLIKRQVI